jgi:outer membrane protein assembly factor BamB
MYRNYFFSLLICLNVLLAGCEQETVPRKASTAEKNVHSIPVNIPVGEICTDWPCLHGPYQDSSSKETGLNFNWGENPPPLLWSVPSGTGYSTPVTKGDTIFTFCRLADEEILQALSTVDGHEIWSRKWPTTFESQFSSYSDGPYCTPYVEGDRIYCIGAEFRLSCLSVLTGEILWEREIMQEFMTKPGLFAVGTGICIHEDLLFLNVGAAKKPMTEEHSDNGVVAFNKNTGKTVWQCTTEDRSYCTPRVYHLHEQDFLIVFAEKHIVCLNPKSGKIDWQVPFGAAANPRRVNATSSMLIGDVLINVAGPNIGLLCLKIKPDRSVEELSRTVKILDSQYNNLVVKDHHVFGFISPLLGKVNFRCVDIHGPNLVWEYQSNLKRGMTVAVDNHLILLGEFGHLAALEFNTNKLKVISHTKDPVLKDPCYSAPIVSQGKLYLKNEIELKCFDLKNIKPGSPK